MTPKPMNKLAGRKCAAALDTPLAQHSANPHMISACRYFLTPKPQLLQERKETAISCQAEIKTLKETQASIQKAIAAVENEFRELIEQSPALQQVLSRPS